MDRTSLLESEVTRMLEHQDVFDDEFEVEDFDMVADGMTNSGHDRQRDGVLGRGSGEEQLQPVQRVAARYAPVSTASTAWPSRDSTRISRGAVQNPFSSLEDEDGQRTPSLSFDPDAAPSHRSVSSASSHHFARSASPRFGAGPSHPYGMYPQETMPRSPSIATSSTARPAQRQSSLRNEPQHPYTLYPQGVGTEEEDHDDDEDEDNTPQNPVTVGFPGLGQPYHRRRGPDGEEQDILGADGHSEPLPPYSRYPEDGPEKMPLLVPTAPTALHSRAPVAGTDPGMPLMHTPLQPQEDPEPAPASMSDQSTLLRSTSRVGSMSPQGSVDTKKSWSEKTWKEKRKTRFFGIPFWWILLAVCVIAFITAVIGGVIGGFVENQSEHNQSFSVSTSLYDASAMTTTPTISPPTGTFALSLSTPQETQAECLTTTSQQAAWSCDLAGDPDVAIVVEQLPNSNQSGANIFYASQDQQLCYGTQVMYMQTPFSPFLPVLDNDNPHNGPAFYFQQYYDKVVVVPQNALNANTGKIKRQSLNLAQGWLQQKQVAQAGDQPWVCVWNNTFLEGFIYVQQPISPTFSMTSSSMTPTNTSSSSPTSSVAYSPAPTAMGGSRPFQGPPGATITTTCSFSSTTATYVGPASGYPAWSAGFAYPSGAASTAHGKRQDSSSELYDSLQLYPYVVKLEERRLSGNTVQPYCQQVQILDNGGTNPVPGPDGQPNIIKLNEQDPRYGAYQSAGVAGNGRKLRRTAAAGLGERMVPGSCHCQWMSGQS